MSKYKINSIGFSHYINSVNHIMIGEISIHNTNSIPDGWLECNGSQVAISDYPLLYQRLTGGGTNPWGSASSGYFKLPDLRAMFLRGVGDNSIIFPYSGSGTYYGCPSLAYYGEDALTYHTHDGYFGFFHNDQNHSGVSGRHLWPYPPNSPAQSNTVVDGMPAGCDTWTWAGNFRCMSGVQGYWYYANAVANINRYGFETFPVHRTVKYIIKAF